MQEARDQRAHVLALASEVRRYRNGRRKEAAIDSHSAYFPFACFFWRSWRFSASPALDHRSLAPAERASARSLAPTGPSRRRTGDARSNTPSRGPKGPAAASTEAGVMPPPPSPSGARPMTTWHTRAIAAQRCARRQALTRLASCRSGSRIPRSLIEGLQGVAVDRPDHVVQVATHLMRLGLSAEDADRLAGETYGDQVSHKTAYRSPRGRAIRERLERLSIPEPNTGCGGRSANGRRLIRAPAARARRGDRRLRDRDSNASVEGVCIPGRYVQACIGLDRNENLPVEFRKALSEGCGARARYRRRGDELSATQAGRFMNA